MPVDHASLVAFEVLDAARRWVQARSALRRVLDSKSASAEQVARAKADHNKTAEALEAQVTRLNRFIAVRGRKIPVKQGANFPWKEIFGAIVVGAKAIGTALDETPPSPTIKATVIDMKDE